MTESAIDWSKRKPVNVVDPGLQTRVGKLVTEAMLPVTRATFPTRDAAARACARVIQPLTNRYGVEAGALLFSLTGKGDGPTRVGSPVVGRENCRLSYQCGVMVQNGGRVPGGLLSGYIHSHPVELGFSDNDLYVAAGMTKLVGALQYVTAYVSLPSGRVFAWSSRAMQDHPQRTWSGYAKHSVRRLP
jgi:hypothetical protein